MKKILNLLLMGILAAGLVTCGGEDPEPVLKELTQSYWQAVFRGHIQEAYGMLSDSSRASVTPQEFSESMRFVPFDGEGSNELKEAFAEKAKLTILGIEAKRKEATVHVILLVPTLAALQASLQAQLDSGEIEVEDEAAWMLREMTTALEENRLPTQELRLKMTWVLADDRWRLVF
ncbi:hypothetical protein KAX06_05685 [candidate division WOR-3 bacterium]|nr:hypothetical protein [candidate division WOR-3 bacterium]MCK4334256.1 hypothetical protein [candidate division WOR-3 bacterium]